MIVDIYTDGSCYPNPGGNGGWAFIIIHNNLVFYEESGKISDNLMTNLTTSYPNTNNRMETIACIKALEYCNKFNILSPVIHSDSKLIVQFSSKGIGTKNRDLINKLIKLNRIIKPIYEWVKSHNNHKWNDRADELASYKYKV